MNLPPLEELVNTFEVESAAKEKLDAGTFVLIEGSDRKPFERITLRPRMMVNTTKLDLSLDLLGAKMFAPIIAGPIAQPKRFRPEAEGAIAKGATDAKALFVVAENSAFPTGPADWWYETSSADRAEQAAAHGAKALVVAGPTWPRTAKLPIIASGIITINQAKQAADKGAAAIIVSANPGAAVHPAAVHPMQALPAIVDAIGTRIPILIDGGFRRGTDIMMALALGAKAVLIASPIAWGLAAYGPDGVRYVLEMLQTELARTMAMCGKPNLSAIDRTAVKVHRW